ncbi:tetratricopeptide repeat protein [Spirillospora sp. CA-142024]|uniref:tetratricopeptide repeat protein n=1 Tax=Spirillospora sp. CA-142024 TaxID=3240036 RepID=UPI003D926AAD
MSEARALLESGDIAGLIRHLRFNADGMELAEVARLMEGAAAVSGFDDMQEAAAAMAREQAPQQLYDFGYACIERGIPFLAVPALRRALEMLPDEPVLLMELVSALERENRHAEAVAALEPRVASLEPWPARYLLARNALFAGDLARAEHEAGLLPAPDDQDWRPAHDRLGRTIARARAARAVRPLDSTDLRGWHFALTGGLLVTISPYGFHDGMTGRFAYTSDSFATCRRSLDRLRLILDAAGRRPVSVGLLPDRSSRILGLAAARLFGLPAEPFAPGRPDVLVVAYDLNETEADGLWERAEGQVLFEHASCWTDPPPVSADVTGLLHQVVKSPWGERLRISPAGEAETVPPDDRPVEELADEIVRADPHEDDGADEGVPPDPDEALAAFVRAVGGHWLTGPRDAVRSPGPVPSSRFG